MSHSYRLADEDRERLGCPEWLPLALVECTIDDITYLSDRFDFDLEDWPEVLQGDIPFEFAGTPDAESKRRKPRWAGQAILWLALHQSDVPASWDEVGRVKLLKVAVREDEVPGKDPAADGADPDPDPDPTPEPSTTPPSSTSSPD